MFFMTKYTHRLTNLASHILALSFISTAVAQQDLVVTLNEDSRFVVHPTDDVVETLGIEFRSPSGSLVPPTSNDASPFTFFLAKTPHQVTYANLGWKVSIAEPLTLEAGWQPGREKDVSFSYADGPNEIGPFQIPAAGYDGICINCFPVTAFFDDQNRIVLNGSGQQIVELTFNSPSGSLRGGTDTGPFTNVSGDEHSIHYSSPEGLALDGTAVLESRWAFGELGSRRDVSYEYRVADEDQTFSFPIDNNSYPERPPLGVTLDAANRFVIQGNGHPVTDFSLSSDSGSLVNSAVAAPFESVTHNGTNSIAYGSNANEPYILDEPTTLETRWAFGENGTRPDVTYQYSLADDSKQFSGSLDLNAYPEERRWAPIGVGFDEDDRIILTGDGQPLRGLQIRSFTGSIVPGSQTNPFERVLTSNPSAVVYESDSNVVLDGSVTLDAAWDRLGTKDLQLVYDLDQVSTDTSVFVPRSSYPIVPFCVDGAALPFSVTVNKRNQIVLHGQGHQLTELTIESESGSLVPGDLPSPFDAFASNSEQLIELTSAEPITVTGALVLSAGWNADSDTQDMIVDTGPMPLPGGSFPHCSTDPVDIGEGVGGHDGVLAFVDLGGRLIISGDGIDVAGVDVVSRGGHLVPVPEEQGAEPFSFFLSNSPNQVTWGNLGGTVSLDGPWQTGVLYTGNDPASDLLISLGNGATPIAIPVSGPIVPEPHTSQMALLGLAASLSAIRRRKS